MGEINFELKPEEKSEPLPIFIHRWFENGEGLAYHPSINLGEITNYLDRVLKYGEREGEKGIKQISEKGGWVIYVMRPDHNTKDPKAKNRSQFYLTATIVYGQEPTGETLDKIYRQLENLPEIESKGPNDDLII